MSTLFMFLGISCKGTDLNLIVSRGRHWLQLGKLRHRSIKLLALDARAVSRLQRIKGKENSVLSRPQHLVLCALQELQSEGWKEPRRDAPRRPEGADSEWWQR